MEKLWLRIIQVLILDANECNNKDVCRGRPCVNIPRSYMCSCGTGYLATKEGRDCEGRNYSTEKQF